ncbi:MAG: CPBP family intramembrane metalloprotease [Caldilineaceae bacterium]|nr:CPBP family intramembrane metalloprotease [Caldilineaceae bacterium]
MSKAPFPSFDLPDELPTANHLPWTWRDVGKAILLIVVGTFVLGAIIVGVAALTDTLPTEGQGMAAAPFFWLGTAIYGVVILAVYLFAARRAPTAWAALGLRPFSSWWVFLAPFITFVELLGMSLVNLVFVLPFTGGEFENPQIEALTGGSALSNQDFFLLLILIAVIAPIAEELFFRGMLYALLRERWSAPIAILANGFLFAFIHFIPLLIPGLFLVGIVLAWVRERSGSLIPCMLVHALQNGIVLVGIYGMMNGASA